MLDIGKRQGHEDSPALVSGQVFASSTLAKGETTDVSTGEEG